MTYTKRKRILRLPKRWKNTSRLDKEIEKNAQMFLDQYRNLGKRIDFSFYRKKHK